MSDHSASADQADRSPITRRDVFLLSGTIGLCLLLYLLFTDRVAGLFADDAWYALLAKSIATGHGYQVINSPTPGILPLYPPLYSLLLSIPFRLFPDFPQNVIALKSVSIAAMMGLGVVGFFYFSRYRRVPVRLSLILVALSLLCQPLMFLATSSLMSECVFALEMMATYLVGERIVGKAGAAEKGLDWTNALLLAALVAAVFLTRTIGVVLVAGVLIDLVRKRFFREFVIVVLFSGLVVGSWTLYTRSRVPTPEQRIEQGGNIIMNYREAFWQRVAGVDSGKPVTWSELPNRVWENVRIIVDTGALYICAPPLPRILSSLKDFSPQLPVILRLLASVALVLLIISGYFSAVRAGVTAAELGMPLMLTLIVIWPFRPLRFLAPLAPFIFFYLITGAGQVWQWMKRGRQVQVDGYAPTLAVAVILLATSMIGHCWSLYDQQAAGPMSFTWEEAFEDNERLMAWVSANIPKSEVIISNNPALLTLFTGHKSVHLNLTPARWEFFRNANLRYVVVHQFDGNNVSLPGNNFVLHRITNEANFGVIDLGPPANRPAYVP